MDSDVSTASAAGTPLISSAEWLGRLERLAQRDGLLLSTLRERSQQDFELVLASAALFVPVRPVPVRTMLRWPSARPTTA
jgi:hypothetical protein